MQAGFRHESAVGTARSLPEKDLCAGRSIAGFPGFEETASPGPVADLATVTYRADRCSVAFPAQGLERRAKISGNLTELLEDLLFMGLKTRVRVLQSAFVAPPPHLTELFIADGISQVQRAVRDRDSRLVEWLEALYHPDRYTYRWNFNAPIRREYRIGRHSNVGSRVARTLGTAAPRPDLPLETGAPDRRSV